MRCVPRSTNLDLNDETMIVRTCGRLFVVWKSEAPPTDLQFNALLQAIKSLDLTTARGLVLTDGGAPNAAQREAFAKLIEGKQLPIAVVSDDVGVRFVASLLAMVTKRIRSFSTKDLTAAFLYLALTPEETELADELVATVNRRAER